MENAQAEAGPRRQVSLALIARMAGVSPPTVSKVLNGRAGVSDATRRRIEEALHRHGYQKFEYGEPSATVELVFQCLDSLWALEILRGVEEVARGAGMTVTVTDMQGELTPDDDWGRQVLDRRPAGVVMVSAQPSTAQQDLLLSRRVPLAVIDSSGEPSPRFPSVGVMNWNGGLLAARHLLELGHRRIAAIAGPERYLGCRARLDGYRAALDGAGVPVDPTLIRSAEFYVEGGQEAAADLLGRPDPPTAILTANDLQALGVYQAARAAGLAVPDDLSVVGFDDLPFVRWLGPPLTTVRQPLAQMGAAAAGMILELSAGRQPDHDRIELPTTLVVRESTAPAH